MPLSVTTMIAFWRGFLAGKFHHYLGAADFIGEDRARPACIRGGRRRRAGKLLLILSRPHGELHVDVTIARPELHLAAGFSHDPLAEVLVGHEEDFAVGRGRTDDFHGVAAGADDVAERFHAGAQLM